MAYLNRITLVDSNGNVYDSIKDPEGNYHLGVAVVQDVNTDANNSSSTNLASNATFTGTKTSVYGFGIITPILKADQTCTVFIDQSGDGTNYDVTDTFFYIPGVPFAPPIQIAGQAYRIRVTNTGGSTTTVFRLESLLTPVGSPLPRSLDPYSNLKVGLYELSDQYGFAGQFDPARQLLTMEPCNLVGTPFQGTSNDANFWTPTNNGAGSSSDVGTTTAATATMVSGTVNSGYGALSSVRIARFIPGSPGRFRCYSAVTAVTVANTSRVWGCFTTSAPATPADGFFFALNGSGVLSVNSVKAGNVNSVSSGSFNGLASTYTLDTNMHVWEIVYTTSAAWFLVDGILLHKISATSSILSTTLHVPINFYAANSASGTTPATLLVWNSSIYRLGKQTTNGRSQQLTRSGADVNSTLKIGPGTIHQVIFQATANNMVVTLYDNTTNSAPIVWQSGTISTAIGFQNIDFHGTPFYTGLNLAVTGANGSVFVAYE